MRRQDVLFTVSLLVITSLAGGRFLAEAGEVTTSVVATPAVVTLSQNDYRWYENLNALTPTTPLAAENTTTTTPSAGTVLRLRINITDGGVQLATGAIFKLQYATSTSGTWTDLSTSTTWIFFDNPSVADGQIIVSTVLDSSDVGESYDESNPSAATPNAILENQRGEWDWVIRNNFANEQSDWYFRMVYSSSTLLDFYIRYPKLSAAPAPPVEEPTVTPSPGSGGGGGGTGFFRPPIIPPLPVPPPLIPPRLQIVDCNGDNVINIIDLSVMLFYYGQEDHFPVCADLDLNGEVGFPDVSILMFYWTG